MKLFNLFFICSLILNPLTALAQKTAALSVVTAQETEKSLTQLTNDYWQAYLKNNPTYATFIGEHRYNNRLDDLSAENRKMQLAELDAFAQRLTAIDASLLSEKDKVTRSILAQLLEFDAGHLKHNFHQWNIDHMYGPQTWFAQLMNFTPLATESDAKNLLDRFQTFPIYIDQYIANLKEGLTQKRAAARLAVERVIKQTQAMTLKAPHASPFGDKVKTLPKELAESYEETAMAAISTQVYPALERLVQFLKDDYLPQSRAQAVGLSSLPNGKEAYRFLIRFHTTTDYTAEKLHAVGLEELKKIQQEMQAVAAKLGHKGELAAFMARARSDPKNFFSTRDEIVASAKKNVEAAYQQLPKFFLSLPQIYCDVLPIEDYREKDAVAAFYYQPDQDGKRPGIYYINTYNPPSRTRYTMAALAAHEAVPGHHLQIATALEAKELPEFRRQRDFTAFTEGWGLYSERLAEEMGFYPDPMSRFGMLTYQAWRACRLVVDTGIHAMGWSREKAIEFMKTNAPLSEEEIINEVDRYIIWPGQALAYKVGQMEIESLRAYAKTKLGEKFDLREFHDVLLKNGSIPLPTTRELIERWVQERARG